MSQYKRTPERLNNSHHLPVTKVNPNDLYKAIKPDKTKAMGQLMLIGLDLGSQYREVVKGLGSVPGEFGVFVRELYDKAPVIRSELDKGLKEVIQGLDISDEEKEFSPSLILDAYLDISNLDIMHPSNYSKFLSLDFEKAPRFHEHHVDAMRNPQGILDLSLPQAASAYLAANKDSTIDDFIADLPKTYQALEDHAKKIASMKNGEELKGIHGAIVKTHKFVKAYTDLLVKTGIIPGEVAQEWPEQAILLACGGLEKNKIFEGYLKDFGVEYSGLSTNSSTPNLDPTTSLVPESTNLTSTPPQPRQGSFDVNESLQAPRGGLSPLFK